MCIIFVMRTLTLLVVVIQYLVHHMDNDHNDDCDNHNDAMVAVNENGFGIISHVILLPRGR